MSPAARAPTTIDEEVVSAVARAFGVRGPDILGDDRHQTIALARKAVAYILREHAKFSYPEIARALCYTDHTSAMAACQTAERLIRLSPGGDHPPYKVRQAARFRDCLRAAEAALVASGV